MFAKKIMHSLNVQSLKSITIILSLIITFYFWDFGHIQGIDTRYLTLVPLLFFLKKEFIIQKSIFPILVINLYVVFQYIWNFLLYDRVFNASDLKYFLAFSLTTLMVFFCKEIILLHKKNITKFLIYLAPLFLISIFKIEIWPASDLMWQCSIFDRNSYIYNIFFLEPSHFAMVAIPAFLLNLFYLCKKFNFINFLFVIIFFITMTIFLSTTMIVASILSITILLISNFKEMNKKFILSCTILMITYFVIFVNIYGCSRKVSDLLYHNYILALQDVALDSKSTIDSSEAELGAKVKKLMGDGLDYGKALKEAVCGDFRVKDDIIECVPNDTDMVLLKKKNKDDVLVKKTTSDDVLVKKTTSDDVLVKKTTSDDVLVKKTTSDDVIYTKDKDLTSNVKQKAKEAFIYLYEKHKKKEEKEIKKIKDLNKSSSSSNLIGLDGIEREKVFQKINVTSQVAQNSFGVAIKTLKIKPLGIGLNRFSDAFIEQLGSQRKNYSIEVMSVNHNDGSGNLNKLLGEFGIVFFIICIYILIFVFSKKISIENKLFLFPLVLTQMVRGAGYFNGGFLVAVVLIVLIVHDTRKKN